MSKYIIEISDEPVGKDIFNIIDISKMAITKESLDKLEKYEESEEHKTTNRRNPTGFRQWVVHTWNRRKL